MGISLETAFLNKTLRNPTILASGILGMTGASLARVAREGNAGALTTKSISLNERTGHNNPVISEFSAGFINAVGLPCSGIDSALEELKYALKNSSVPVIASIFADTVQGFGVVAENVSGAKPDFIEVNVSCPNVEAEFGRPFGTSPEVSAKVTEVVKNSTKIPVIIKLSPNVSNIALIAKAVEEAGADAISAINTVGPGMLIDIKTAKPILHNKFGGISGPAIKPVAVRCVYEIKKAVNIPIIGIGGISNGNDAIEMMMAGATCVGIGSAVHYHGIKVFDKICNEIQEFMKENNYTGLKEIIGKALE